MTQKEINEALVKGGLLALTFGTRYQRYYSIGESKITEKQFDKTRALFKEKLSMSIEQKGLTKHVYKYKES